MEGMALGEWTCDYKKIKLCDVPKIRFIKVSKTIKGLHK